MRKLKPQAYLDEVYPGAGYTTKTVINWIKAGKIKGEQTVTGRWLVLIDDKAEFNVSYLVKLLEAAA
jgi:hypothetical protein